MIPSNQSLVALLQPGDHLLYGGTDFVDRCIQLKTWSDVAHIEIYAGDGMSVASRNGIGVGYYPLRSEGLKHILRPWPALQRIQMSRGMEWFWKHANGQKYDFLGLMCFFLAVKRGSPDRMFCSEFARNFDKACGFHPFADHWPSDKVAPGNFEMSPAFTWINFWPGKKATYPKERGCVRRDQPQQSKIHP